MPNTSHAPEHVPQPEAEKNETLLPLSIIVGAVLISASLFYNTKLIVKKLQPQTLALGGTAAQQGQQGGQAALPEGRVEVTQRKDAATLGKSSAPVTVEIFTDFQCPFCQRFANDAYKQIKETYVDTGKAKFVYRHFPLSIHAKAQKAGEAAECANRQGKFVAYHDMLFAKAMPDGTNLDIDSLKKYAKDTGLNVSKFNTCLDKSETAEIVKKDLADGGAAGVSGTPTIFINGNRVVGAQPFAAFQQLIETELSK